MPDGGSVRVLITVSGVIAPDVVERVERGERPRVDYIELARGIGADLLDVAEARRRCRLCGPADRTGGGSVGVARVGLFPRVAAATT